MVDLPQTKAAEDWLKLVLDYCNLPTLVQTELPESVVSKLHQFGGHWLTLDETQFSSAQTDVLMAEGGKVLDALQYLVNATLNLGQDATEKTAYTIELSGHRAQRYLQLAQIAEEVAQQVRQTGEEVEMIPLPPAERRLIHTLLGEEPDLETFSRGQEPQRRLVVGPKSNSQG